MGCHTCNTVYRAAFGVNRFLDGEKYTKISLISIFSPFWFSSIILSYRPTLISPVPQLQTQQLMTPQIRSYVEHLIQTNSILVLILYFKMMQ